MLRAFVCLSVLVVLSQAACPNDCSGHGTCNAAFVCTCSTGYAGDDCSIPDSLLINHQIQHGHVNTREWQYYHIQANSDKSDLVIEVNQTGTSGDCDTYVRLGNYPTRQTYDYRDISTMANSRIEIPHPNGVYYIGVYGFLGGDFDIQAYVKTDCLNDCSGHGRCSDTSVCICSSGYSGADCSTAIGVLQNNTVASGYVLSKAWDYYTFTSNLNTLKVQVNQTGAASEDCDLYIKYGAMPDLSNFDYRDTTTGTSSFEIKVTNARVGTYNIGVYGFKECHYNIKALSFNECPNQCSGQSHGVCSTSVACRCNVRFSGTACETMVTPLTYETPMTGFVEDNFWNYYHFTPSVTSNVLVNLVQDSDTMDCDLYIRKQADPTRFQYDYRDISFRSNITITMENPAFVDYYIGVYGYKSCSYTLTTHVTLLCPNSCTDATHGTCQNGHCICKDAWTGEDCSMPNNALTNGQTVHSSVRGGDWKYYSFNAQAGLEVTVLMKEKNSVGFLWLYGARDSYPSMNSFDFSDTETNTATHRMVFTPKDAMLLQIAVFGSPLSITGDDYNFDLVVWQASF